MRRVRLIGPEGEDLGLMPVGEARRWAELSGLLLGWDPAGTESTVARLVRPEAFARQTYERKKAERSGVAIDDSERGPKQLRVRPGIDGADLESRLAHGRRFLEDGHVVQVLCILRGRQLNSPELGFDVLRRVHGALEDLAALVSGPELVGNRVVMRLAPR